MFFSLTIFPEKSSEKESTFYIKNDDDDAIPRAFLLLLPRRGFSSSRANDVFRRAAGFCERDAALGLGQGALFGDF